MGRSYTRIHRLLRLLAIIQSRRGLKAQDLAGLLNITERTIYGDLNALKDAGIPCDFDIETQGYRVRPGFFMPPVEFTADEAMALVLLLEQTSQSDQIPYLSSVSKAVEKIRAQLPPQMLEEITPLDDRVQIDMARSQADHSARDVFDEVRDAIVRRRLLLCRYESATSPSDDSEFEFRPYVLWFCQRAWYAVGYHGGRQEVRHLKLNRFISVRPTDRPYHIPEDFNMRAHLGNAWRMRGGPPYHVRVQFSDSFADNASETRWHHTQQEQWNSDGSVTLSFDVDGLDEIVWWVLGYGPEAKVLEPPELIDMVKSHLKRAAELYNT
jgi:predicted DNA-binding transcriptional regulator YafY